MHCIIHKVADHRCSFSALVDIQRAQASRHDNLQAACRVYRRESPIAEKISASQSSPRSRVSSLPDAGEKEDGPVSVPRYACRNDLSNVYQLSSLGFRRFSMQDRDIVVAFDDATPVTTGSRLSPMCNRSCDLATFRQLQVETLVQHLPFCL